MIEPRAGITFADFIAWEQEQEERHELIGGEIVAPLAGGSLDHSGFCINIVTKLRATVEPPCQAFNSAAILETATRPAANGFRAVRSFRVHPRTSERRFVRAPLIIVEVLSPSNSGRKWNAKLIEYTTTRSIAKLVLVESKTRAASSYVWQGPLTVSDRIRAFDRGVCRATLPKKAGGRRRVPSYAPYGLARGPISDWLATRGAGAYTRR
jgi:Uma2 family endonuclease